MANKAQEIEVVIVGGGRRCRDLLTLFEEYEPRRLRLKILGVADPDPEAPGAKHARLKGLFVTEDFRQLLKRFPKVDLVIELTGRDEVLEEIFRLKARKTKVLDHVGATLFAEIITLFREKSLYERRLAEAETRSLTMELICHLAHRIRNPLTVIGGLAKRLTKDPKLPPETQRYIRVIADETERLEQVMEELTEVTEPLKPRFHPVDLNALVRKVGRTFQKDLPPGVRIELRLEPDIPVIYADAGLLEKALWELLKNAFEAFEEQKGHIILETRLCYDSTAMVVIDDGPGMDEKTLQKATLPFFTTKFKASGLGLYLVKKVARAHGGRLYLYSRPGEGTIAALELPMRVRKPVPPV